jgi:hypothetical protein
MLTGDEPEMVDHRNGDPADNRATNLRAATNSTNQMNQKLRRGKLLPKGVTAEGKRFVAFARQAGRKVSIGRFDTPAEAHAAWREWARVRHGTFFNPGAATVTVFD